MKQIKSYALLFLILVSIPVVPSIASEPDALSTRKNFEIDGRRAFTMIPPILTEDAPIPWVWYAPTLGKGLPGTHEAWMFNSLHKQGIAISGIDVGESYGSPRGVKLYQALYDELTKRRGFSKKPVLLARSRGGLMLYSWASRHPTQVAAIAGIYPVCNVTSYPGIERAAPAYGLSPAQLKEQLRELNPIELLDPLARQQTPIFHIHGDQDRVVPIEPNSQLLVNRINAKGGAAKVEIIKGQGHNLWVGWFTHQQLIEFMIKHATPGEQRNP